MTAARRFGYSARTARKLRIQYAAAIYHVMNRGDRREGIFADDQDRQRFLETLTEACQKTGWQVHACCLLGCLDPRVQLPGAEAEAAAGVSKCMTLFSSAPRRGGCRWARRGLRLCEWSARFCRTGLWKRSRAATGSAAAWTDSCAGVSRPGLASPGVAGPGPIPKRGPAAQILTWAA